MRWPVMAAAEVAVDGVADADVEVVAVVGILGISFASRPAKVDTGWTGSNNAPVRNNRW